MTERRRVGRRDRDKEKDRQEGDRQTDTTERDTERERGKGEAAGSRVASLRGDRGGILQVQSLNKNAKQNAPIQ